MCPSSFKSDDFFNYRLVVLSTYMYFFYSYNPTTGESSNNRLSCANGCELAYYSSNLHECAEYCTDGNASDCTYCNPLIDQHFEKCGSCQNGCSKYQTDRECFTGCEYARFLQHRTWIGRRNIPRCVKISFRRPEQHDWSFKSQHCWAKLSGCWVQVAQRRCRSRN